MKSRRAVSPIMAVIILIGIAMVGGVFLGNAQRQFLNTALSNIEYKITDLRLEKDSHGSCFFIAKLYNSGTETITSTKINTTLDSGLQWFPTNVSSLNNAILPGETLPVFVQFSGNSCGNFTLSNTYSIGFEANSESSSYKTIVPLKVKDMTR